jgi:hypothetical protein
MHYERAPRFRRSKLDVAPPSLHCAVHGFAPLQRLDEEGHRQIGWRMALYLGGKIRVDTNDLPPKEATAMSRRRGASKIPQCP